MFKPNSLAEFHVNGANARVYIDNSMSVEGLKAIANKIIYFCEDLERTKEKEEAERKLEEELNRKPKLEEASKQETQAAEKLSLEELNETSD